MYAHLPVFYLAQYPCKCMQDANYLFLGDYVDRGKQSLETICLLLVRHFLAHTIHSFGYIERNNPPGRRIKSSIPRISSFCEETTNVRQSIDCTDFTTNVNVAIISNCGRRSRYLICPVLTYAKNIVL